MTHLLTQRVIAGEIASRAREILAMAALLSALVSFCSVAVAAEHSLSVPRQQETAHEALLTPVETGERVVQHILAQGIMPPRIPAALQLESVLALYDVTGNEKYLDFVRESVLSQSASTRLDPFSSMGFELFERTQELQDMGTFEAQARAEKKNGLRAFDGAISFYLDQFSVLKQPEGDINLKKEWAPIFIDHLQEYASRMARLGWLTGKEEFYRESVQQVLIFRTALRDHDTGLWAHGRGWYESAQNLTAIKWGRGHAWLIRTLVETMTYLPPDSPEFVQISNILHDVASVLARYQDEQGFWHQIVDDPESYQESSATGLLSYYFARAVHQGYLPREPYEEIAKKAFKALAKDRISSSGEVYGGVKSTPPQPSVELYLKRATPVNDAHALAAAIFSAVGLQLLEGEDYVPPVPPQRH